MNNWKKTTLGEISINNRGYYGIGASAVDYDINKYTYLRITDINDDGTLNKNGLKSVDDPNAINYLLEPNDIVFARTGNSTGRNYFYDGRDGKLVYAGFLIKFSIDPNKINPKYVKYFLMSNEYKGWVSSFNTGSTRGNINAQTYATLEISLLPTEQQNFIADVLSALDDKIEVNNKINENLEAQAQAIFKQWFVDFEFPDTEGKPYKTNGGEFIDSELGEIPIGWRVGTLGEIVEVIDNRGKTPPLSDKKTEYPIIDVRALNGVFRFVDYNNCMKFVNNETYNSWFRSGHPKENDILISTVGSLAEMKIFTGNIGAIAQNVVALRPHISTYYLYQYLLYIKSDILCYDIGSVQPSIKVTHIIKHKILIPSVNNINMFDKIMNGISKKISNNQNEISNLSEIRDSLLPKLMNGEVRV